MSVGEGGCLVNISLCFYASVAYSRGQTDGLTDVVGIFQGGERAVSDLLCSINDSLDPHFVHFSAAGASHCNRTLAGVH